MSAVEIENDAPDAGSIALPEMPVQLGTVVSVSALFTDTGPLDRHTATWSWGDGTTSAGTVTESNGSGFVAGNHLLR